MITYKYSKNMRILFIGINPHPGSYKRHVPFSNNKMLWYLFSRAGIIDESIEDLKDDDNLKKIYNEKFNQIYDLGFMNIAKRPTVDATYLKKGEEKEGIEEIKSVIKKYTPRVVCFIGKVTYQKFIGTKKLDYGWKENIGGSKVFVMHFPLRGHASIRIEELVEIKLASQK